MRKPLFLPEDLDTGEPEELESSATRYSVETYRAVIGKAYGKVEQVIGPVTRTEIIEFTSAGSWSTHELLVYLLSITGPARVYIATWSMTERAARTLIDLVDRQLITGLSMVLDFRTQNRHPQAYHLARQNIAQLRTTAVHAKVTVIENDTWQITIVGSANYTNNRRIEAGIINPDPRSAKHHKSWILQLIDHGEPFE